MVTFRADKEWRPPRGATPLFMKMKNENSLRKKPLFGDRQGVFGARAGRERRLKGAEEADPCRSKSYSQKNTYSNEKNESRSFDVTPSVGSSTQFSKERAVRRGTCV